MEGINMGVIGSPWFIGIIGSILAGLLVTFITRYFFSRNDNREYMQKVVTANHEMLYAIRPGISEGVIPTEDVLNSLISATALKYSVDADDLYSATTFVEVLVKEVMDSSFLAASTKADFCQKLAQLRPTLKPAQSTAEITKTLSTLSNYRHRMITMMSWVMGVMVAIMTMAFTLIEVDRLKGKVPGSNLMPAMIKIFMIIGIASGLLISIVKLLVKLQKERHNPSSSSHED